MMLGTKCQKRTVSLVMHTGSFVPITVGSGYGCLRHEQFK